MNSLPLFYSNHDYYRNYNFIRLQRNWNKYLDYNGVESEEMMAEWEEVCLNDFYDGAYDWLFKNRAEIFWRVGLE